MNSDKKIGSNGLIKTVKSDFGDFWINYFDKYEAVCEKALAYESGP
jgi:hypothetical protein